MGSSMMVYPLAARIALFLLSYLATRIAAQPYNATSFTIQSRDTAIRPGFPYGSQKIRGVNLGGWLVLEPWITPKLFDDTGDSRVIDEYTFGQYVPANIAISVLQGHWNSWITEADFIAIAAAGLNHVRLPIGYWAFDVSGGEPYHQGQLPYLQKAVTWAGDHGLKVIIDLHGAPGSQNGFDNSGQKLPYPRWQSNPENVARTTAIIKQLANLFKDQTNVVTAIAPLNEPAGFYHGVLPVVEQYWHDSYESIRYPSGNQKSNLVQVIHDAFQSLSQWDGFEAPPAFQGVMMDTHIYQMFSTEEVAQTWQQHIASACAQRSRLASLTTLWLVVGEWTTGSTDCAGYLNGRDTNSRYSGSYPGSTYVGSCAGLSGSAKTFSSDYKSFMRKFYEAQIDSYEGGAQGWIYWTWKAENADDWSYQAGLAGGWIPRNPTDRQFPNICS